MQDRVNKENKNLVEFSVDFTRMKLFKKVPELQSINGNNLCASPLPCISETIQTVKGDYSMGNSSVKAPEMGFTMIQTDFSHHNGIK